MSEVRNLNRLFLLNDRNTLSDPTNDIPKQPRFPIPPKKLSRPQENNF